MATQSPEALSSLIARFRASLSSVFSTESRSPVMLWCHRTWHLHKGTSAVSNLSNFISTAVTHCVISKSKYSATIFMWCIQNRKPGNLVSATCFWQLSPQKHIWLSSLYNLYYFHYKSWNLMSLRPLVADSLCVAYREWRFLVHERGDSLMTKIAMWLVSLLNNELITYFAVRTNPTQKTKT